MRINYTDFARPWFFLVGVIACILKVYWYGDSTFDPPTSALSWASELGNISGKDGRVHPLAALRAHPYPL